MKPELQVWWIPQIPMKAFEYQVPSVGHGKLLLDALAKYDQFQLDNNIKPDYSNVGGLAWRHEIGTEGEWWDVDPDDDDDMADFQKFQSSNDGSK